MVAGSGNKGTGRRPYEAGRFCWETYVQLLCSSDTAQSIIKRAPLMLLEQHACVHYDGLTLA